MESQPRAQENFISFLYLGLSTVCHQFKFIPICNFVTLAIFLSVCVAHELWLRQQPKLVEHG
jgi:hypothetical protein